MLDSETVVRAEHEATVTQVDGKRHKEVRDPRTSVSMKDEGVEILVFFTDLSGEGEVLEVRVLPQTAPISPEIMARVGKRFSLYAQYARAAVQWNDQDVRETLKTLRGLGTTSRGLSDDHYVLVARVYKSLVAEGSSHPVKALGEQLHTDISNASRWIKEARRRGYIEPQEASHGS